MFKWLENVFLNKSSFLVGSRIYGRPTETSDIDLVILCDYEHAKELYRNCHGERKHDTETESFILHYDNLNLIVCTNPEVFKCWRYGLNECLTTTKRKGVPLSRQEAKDIFESYRVQSKVPDFY